MSTTASWVSKKPGRRGSGRDGASLAINKRNSATCSGVWFLRSSNTGGNLCRFIILVPIRHMQPVIPSANKTNQPGKCFIKKRSKKMAPARRAQLLAKPSLSAHFQSKLAC